MGDGLKAYRAQRDSEAREGATCCPREAARHWSESVEANVIIVCMIKCEAEAVVERALAMR